MSHKCIGVLTSGGDAPGMNAAVRAVVRAALQKEKEVKVYTIYEGYQGMIEGGRKICEMNWPDVSGIMLHGGTVIGSARCKEFKTRTGQLRAAENLLRLGIDRLIVIGGDGTLRGANAFSKKWPKLLQELGTRDNKLKKMADDHPHLYVVGLVSSIDNDMLGTDITIGADSALHRINEAVDAISSTAASHKRIFVVKVMGRDCGYLALMSAVITGADWFFIPEDPPEVNDWKTQMCTVLQEGRDAKRRATIVILAEGTRDRNGKPIKEGDVKDALKRQLGADVRISVLGHVQRGGTPSAFDRNISTRLGHAAVNKILAMAAPAEPLILGMEGNKIVYPALRLCLKKNREIENYIRTRNYQLVREERGKFFEDAFRTAQVLKKPSPPQIHLSAGNRFRFAILHSGTATPGMNTAVRAAVRLAIAKGHKILGVERGFNGLIHNKTRPLNWMSVNGLAQMGGAELGTTHKIPAQGDLQYINGHIRKNKIQGLLIIGGWSGYQGALQLYNNIESFENFKIPVICMPATICNNLPGTEASIGADTALNNIMEALDKIKQSSVSSSRCFLMEVGGSYCGYLALMSGLESGAERVYLHENGVTLKGLTEDLKWMKEDVKKKRRHLALMIRNENAYRSYDASFMKAFFKEESEGLFEMRSSTLGDWQYEGNPSPFDRILATRLADECINFLVEEAKKKSSEYTFVGIKDGEPITTKLEEFPDLVNDIYQRPIEQWWMDLLPVYDSMRRV